MFTDWVLPDCDAVEQVDQGVLDAQLGLPLVEAHAQFGAEQAAEGAFARG